MSPNELRIDIWSDIACPWCYIGKRRLEVALTRFPQRDSVEVVWRSFELDPTAPAIRPQQPYEARLARKYGVTNAQAKTMIDRMVAIAEQEGLRFRFEMILPGNTFDAHRLIHLGRERRIQDAVKQRFFRGYFCEGAAIGDRSTLLRLASEAGLDRDEAERVLESSAFAREVRADEEDAHASEIHSVPFFVFGGRYAISGAQSAETLLHVLERTYRDQTTMIAAAAVGPDGCPV